MTLLSVSDLSVSFGARRALDSVSLSAEGGEIIGLLGPNGAGKTTLLRALVGLVPRHGQVRVDGTPVDRFDAVERARRIAYLPQDRAINWPVSVETVVAFGRAPFRRSFGRLGRDDRARIESVIEQMGLGALRDRPATTLSGGERARVLIARALAQDAALLLADEPTAGLDPAHQIGVMRCFRDVALSGRAVITSLHDLSLAARWCSRLLVIQDGRLVADGAPDAVLTPEILRDVYRIDAEIAHLDGRLVIHARDTL
ncbi:ABC transporter ATP-binding protein [Consotaella aegiceratis]|uniref:ABC transporter ATP-binding protein n=1 Tax=Consotaella aegiceratis TaxID=3097961 RepID=UPI002F413D1B